ncbi:MAG: septum formation initiator [Bacteroidetes bacterium]|nr:MAG: septum formation initiator [Bacteroidota bacterium]PIE88418.1 MAG: septum formation initiator [Bacteroidota bacterium]
MRLNRIVRDKYFWIITIFLVVMIFFDSNSLLHHLKLNKNRREAREMNAFYKQEIEAQKAFLQEMYADMEYVERFAREEYLMKRDDEDVFVIVEEE